MKIDIEQVWEYEFKPTDTMRLLHAFKNVWENKGDEITLENRGGRLFAVRREKESEIEKHYRLLHDYYEEKYGA
jgi:streptomycin 6-kinase